MESSIPGLIKTIRINARLLGLFLSGFLIYCLTSKRTMFDSSFELLCLISVGALIIAYLIGHKFELAGALLGFAGFIGFYFSLNSSFIEFYYFILFPLPSILFIYCRSAENTIPLKVR
jgi:hypothetical protein